ncbi:MAG: hypothetical protein ACLP59_35010 [Bryobacteraceae bacterium]
MSNLLKAVLSGAALTGAAALLMAGAILHPEMKVETGTYEAPAAELGFPTAEPWSATSIAAGVDKKPESGHPIALVGEIVDVSCYLQLGKHGEKHRSCGQKCVQNGEPVGLVTKDGTLYIVMPEEHDPRRDGGVNIRTAGAENMGHIVKVMGTETRLEGVRAIYVAGLTK